MIKIVRDFILRQRIRELADLPELETAEIILADIANLVAMDRVAARILQQFRGTRADICELYRFLVHGGANRWIHGSYVAASSIANPIILYAYLRDRHQKHDTNFRLGFADACVRYFEGGYTESFLLQTLRVPPGYAFGAALETAV